MRSLYGPSSISSAALASTQFSDFSVTDRTRVPVVTVIDSGLNDVTGAVCEVKGECVYIRQQVDPLLSGPRSLSAAVGDGQLYHLWA
uniref:Uncharacterized protein n=1 Tax=Knipowitschia caucasica TaxID=637954 RepID=A0AAV2MGC0_KNICA